MGLSDRKLEIAITGFAAIMVMGLGYILKDPVRSVLAGTDTDIVYEMPRPKRSFLAALFDLGDREIERKYVNPFSKPKKKEDKKPTGTAGIAPAPTKPVAQQKPVKKKTVDNKAKKKVDVQVVGNDPTKKSDDDMFWNENGAAQQHYADADAGGAVHDQKDKKNTLNANQWRALIMAQPTKENVAKLVEAYNQKEVDDQTFYTIVTDLLRNNKSEVQSYGLAALKSVYNEKSFAVTAKYYDQLSPELQPQAHNYLLSYGVSGRLPFLISALQSSDADVVEAAAQVVMDGHKKAKGGTNAIVDPRASRGDVMLNTVSTYSKFIPVLQHLTQSQDANIASLATTVLNEIQTPVAAL
ncbi:MAG: hypothetical protein ACXVCP_06215 [Bdellovibrio sp.]